MLTILSYISTTSSNVGLLQLNVSLDLNSDNNWLIANVLEGSTSKKVRFSFEIELKIRILNQVLF